MIFKQAGHRRDYTVVSNKVLRDAKLSFKATGLLAFLLSLPEEWQPRSNHLASIKTDGRDSVRSALRELEEAGYLARSRRLAPNGTFDWLIEVHETPQTSDGKPADGNGRETHQPGTGYPVTDEPVTDNPSSKESLRLLTDQVLNSDRDANGRFTTAMPDEVKAQRSRPRKAKTG